MQIIYFLIFNISPISSLIMISWHITMIFSPDNTPVHYTDEGNRWWSREFCRATFHLSPPGGATTRRPTVPGNTSVLSVSSSTCCILLCCGITKVYFWRWEFHDKFENVMFGFFGGKFEVGIFHILKIFKISNWPFMY